MTAMLTAPNENKRPLFAAKDIKDFYLEHCPKIFPQCGGPFAPAVKLFKAISGPTYNGKYLRTLVEKKLGTTLLNETLTNVIIPAFNIKKLQPTIFSSREVESKPYLNALLSDICIGTSAAPTYLPAHHFKTKYSRRKEREFDLIDGGVAANNPELTFARRVLTPNLLDIAKRAYQCNYLRIQDDTLSGSISSVDIATKENLKNLVKAGEQLLKKTVSRVNLDTGIYEPVENAGTNEVALKRFAKKLSDEKRLRKMRSPPVETLKSIDTS